MVTHSVADKCELSRVATDAEKLVAIVSRKLSAAGDKW